VMDLSGKSLSNGYYVCRMTAGNYTKSVKLLLGN
jgi:hypothetical protein